jgi:hypothetical protein
MLLSGALSGLAGMGEIAGVHYQLLDGVDGGFEYTPIVVALLGALTPFGTAVAAFGFAALSVGADAMQTTVGLPSSFVSIIQALIVLFILAGEYVGRLTIERSKPSAVSDQLSPVSDQAPAGIPSIHRAGQQHPAGGDGAVEGQAAGDMVDRGHDDLVSEQKLKADG